ncbi:uncharacterized protein LOC123507380 [Portunus trituberculatus]|uniref:uncharacterized protein LOC123507380 n=1 Tax=Portunus trituberculatus TaxID=210409 RepID=UPI001E1CD9C2|nr:uncharacterized protein LOC123507380 [Portunus trituberculatus]
MEDSLEMSRYTDEEYELACRQRLERESVIYERLITYLRTTRHAPGLTDTERKQVLQRARNFQWNEHDQKLYKLDYDRKCSRLVVRSYEDNMALLHQYHGSPTSGHCGLNATFEKMSQDYYWRNMTQDIKHYIATCTCQPLRRQPSEMCLMKIKEPWKLTGVNLMVAS